MHPFIPYAVKLGYTVEDAEVALSRLGRDATTNALLALVISLQTASYPGQNIFPVKRKTLPKRKRRCFRYKLASLSYVAGPVADCCSWSYWRSKCDVVILCWDVGVHISFNCQSELNPNLRHDTDLDDKPDPLESYLHHLKSDAQMVHGTSSII